MVWKERAIVRLFEKQWKEGRKEGKMFVAKEHGKQIMLREDRRGRNDGAMYI